MTRNPEDLAIAGTIIRLAHSLELRVIAEGVETEGQLCLLVREECDQMQGYYFSRPLPAPEIAAPLERDSRLVIPVAGAGKRHASPSVLMVGKAERLEAVTRVLCDDGVDFVSATDTDEAFELLARHSARIILCPEQLRPQDGVSFLVRVKQMYPKTMRVLIRGASDSSDLATAIENGTVQELIVERASDEKTLRAIRRVVRTRRGKVGA